MNAKSTLRVKLNKLITTEGEQFDYVYDFGDRWEHTILIEKILPPDPKQKLPVCIAGKRACPPEDVGGVWGYEDLLRAIKDPKHPNHTDYIEWIGEGFDPARFDIAEINAIFGDF